MRLEQEKKASCKDLGGGHSSRRNNKQDSPEVGINMAHLKDRKQASEAGMERRRGEQHEMKMKRWG